LKYLFTIKNLVCGVITAAWPVGVIFWTDR
jgi:hypothetical protein